MGIAVGKNLAVGVNLHNDIWFRILSLGKPFGEKWQHIGGKLSSIYIENGVVFGVNPQGELYYRGGIDTAHPFGTTWVKDSSVKLSAPKLVVKPLAKTFLLTIANVDEKGKILFQPTDGRSFGSQWNTIPGSLTQVDSDGDILAGCNRNLDIFMRVGISNTNPIGNSWVQVPGKLKQVDIGDGKMAGVYKDSSIFVAHGNLERPASLKWFKIDGGLTQISVRGGNIAGIYRPNGDAIYFRKGIDSKHPYGTSWLRIEGNLKMIAVGKNLAVGVNSLNDIYFRTLSLGKPFGEKWQKIGGKLSSIYIENGVVFGVSPVGELFYRGGIDTTHPFGTTWVRDSSVKLSAPKRVVVQ